MTPSILFSLFFDQYDENLASKQSRSEQEYNATIPHTSAFTSIPSSRQLSGTIARNAVNASTSGSTTFASPTCVSASPVGRAVTGISVAVVTVGAVRHLSLCWLFQFQVP